LKGTEIFAFEAETAPFYLTAGGCIIAVCRPFAGLVCTENIPKSMLRNACKQRINGLKLTCKIVVCALYRP
jgi:hypothetical protein